MGGEVGMTLYVCVCVCVCVCVEGGLCCVCLFSNYKEILQ